MRAISIGVFLIFSGSLVAIYNLWLPPWISSSSDNGSDRPPLPVVGFHTAQPRDADRVSAIQMRETPDASMTVKDFRGRYVLMSFWSPDCKPCIEELIALEKIAKKMDRKNLKIVTVVLGETNLQSAKEFLGTLGIGSLPIYADGSKDVISDLQISGLPTTLLIDPAGKEVGRTVGPVRWGDSYTKDALFKFVAKVTKLK